METTRIETTGDPLFAPLWEIYNASFPRVERRTMEHQRVALKSDNYRLIAYTEEDTLLGFIGYWEFPDYIYVEHLAVNPAVRGGGHGSHIMSDLIGSTSKTVILEIEPVENEQTARRLRFYEKLGFRVNPYLHTQHMYHDDDPQGFALVVLSHPKPISGREYDRFNDDLRQEVMKRE